MKENNYTEKLIEVDFGLTHLFSIIYGKDEYYNFKENATLDDFKVNYSKLLMTIKKSFLGTCRNTDKNHKEEIEKLINEEIKNIKKKKTVLQMNVSLVIFYPKLCFLLIGQIPSNYLNRKKDNRSAWALNEYRQIEYKQNRNQQLKLLIHYLINNKIKELKSYKIELENYDKTKFKGENLLDWFKRIHPQLYFKIFDRTG